MAVKPSGEAGAPVDPRSLTNDDMIPYALQMASLSTQQLLPSDDAKSKLPRERRSGTRSVT